jgi:hypothetical protein
MLARYDDWQPYHSVNMRRNARRQVSIMNSYDEHGDIKPPTLIPDYLVESEVFIFKREDPSRSMKNYACELLAHCVYNSSAF